MRLDKYLKVSRLIKRRTVATAGNVRDHLGINAARRRIGCTETTPGRSCIYAGKADPRILCGAP